MEFALVDGERRKPTKGARGVCQCCGAEMIAKCGRIKMWHWAHWPRTSCDPWWGGETDWHREWKGRFPEDWREVVHVDEHTGEKHIADVKTPTGLVIEFQHSPLDDLELISREIFYEDMIWIVDGDRGTTDPQYFRMGLQSEPWDFCPVVHGVEWWGRGRLLARWSWATAPVYIDFGIHGLWRLHRHSYEHGGRFFSPLASRETLSEACERGEIIPLVCVPEEQREDYVARLRLKEMP